MIGMKGFLIAEETYEKILSVIEESGMDALARDGVMIHMETQAGVTASEMNRILIENTPLSMYTESIHSAETIAGFMSILQNAFYAVFAAFALVLFGVAMAVLGHSISGLVEQEWKNLGIMKTIGFTGRTLSGQLMAQYMGATGTGVILGMVLAVPVSGMISRMIVTTTGVLLPIRFPVLPCLANGGTETRRVEDNTGATDADQNRTDAADAVSMENQAAENGSTQLEVRFGDNGEAFMMTLLDNETAAVIAGYVGTSDWRLPIYERDDDADYSVLQYYDIPGRYEIPSDNPETVTEAKAGDVFYSDPNRIVLFYHDAEISAEYTKIGTFEATEDFITAVEENPVLEGWGNKIIQISQP